LLYSAAVGAPPISMTTITEDGAPIMVAPNLELSPYEARQWMHGNLWLDPRDERTYLTEVSEEEWVVYQKHHLRDLLDEVQRLVGAVVGEDRDAIADQIDEINAILDRLRRRDTGS
jgi:hypothetical protein